MFDRLCHKHGETMVSNDPWGSVARGDPTKPPRFSLARVFVLLSTPTVRGRQAFVVEARAYHVRGGICDAKIAQGLDVVVV